MVKTWVDDRGGGTIRKLTPPLYSAIIDEAHKRNMRVVVHATGLVDVKALTARRDVDGFAHMVGDVDDELMELAEGASRIRSSCSRSAGCAASMHAPWIDPPHPLVSDTVLARADQAAADAAGEHKPGAIREAQSLGRGCRAASRGFAAAGVRIGVGTDGGGQQGDQFIGWTMHTELENMVAAGMTPAQVLVAATRTSAGILGLDELGMVAPGKSADFVVLDANPLDDITNTRRINSVYMRGQEIPRPAMRSKWQAEFAAPRQNRNNNDAGETAMRHLIGLSLGCAILSVAVWQTAAEQSQSKFPLAAPAGKDSNARMVAPPGAVNQGPFDMSTWKYGNAPAFTAPSGLKLWNPAKIKLMEGGKVVGGTVRAVGDPNTYCAMANAGYDFIWTEMQHHPSTWDNVVRAWQTCPRAKAVPGARIAYTDEREIQRALDGGALVLVVPTVDTVEEARQAVDWAYFPPLGKRSQGGGAAFAPEMWGNVPGGYRQTINDNLVLILMIETLEGLKNADEIAKVPGVTAIFAASGDLGNFTGYAQGSPDYERAINIVHDAAIKAGVKLCGPFAWRDRPDFTCFQAGNEAAQIARGARAELGDLYNTQGKPEVGPFAGK